MKKTSAPKKLKPPQRGHLVSAAIALPREARPVPDPLSTGSRRRSFSLKGAEGRAMVEDVRAVHEVMAWQRSTATPGG
jgi:hypothetical protein